MIYASCLKRLLCMWVAVLHIVISTLLVVGPVQAQSQSAAQIASDNEPPELDLEIVKTGVAGDSQVFSATVTDNEAIKEVLLFVRFDSSDGYDSVPMSPIPNTSIYTVTVDLPSPDLVAIEYYMTASDTRGNRVARGFAFDPLQRDLVQPSELAAAAVSSEPPRAGISTTRKVLYVGLGILAAGALAVAFSGGSSDGDDDGPAGGPAIPVTITVAPIASALD